MKILSTQTIKGALIALATGAASVAAAQQTESITTTTTVNTTADAPTVAAPVRERPMYWGDEQARWRFGIKGGIGFTNFWQGREVKDDNAKIGFQGGIFVRTPISGIFSVQPELLYVTQGGKLTYNAVVAGRTGSQVNLNYLQLPILFRFSPSQFFSFHIGPYGSYLVNANITKETFGSGDQSESAGKVNRENFNAFDYGAAAGLELNFRYFDIGARYNLGLRQVGDSDIASKLSANGRNNALQFYVAFVL